MDIILNNVENFNTLIVVYFGTAAGKSRRGNTKLRIFHFFPDCSDMLHGTNDDMK